MLMFMRCHGNGDGKERNGNFVRVYEFCFLIANQWLIIFICCILCGGVHIISFGDELLNIIYYYSSSL